MEREAPGGVQQPVAQPLGLAAGQVAVEQQGLGVEDQLLGGEDELQPDLVGGEVAEREVLQAGVLGGADAVLASRAGAMGAFERGDVRVCLVGEDRLEAVAIVIGEAQLGTGMRALAPNDYP